jgi:hypothetical protein
MCKIAFILGLIWGIHCEAVAQTSFTVRGVIQDTVGSFLSKATVRLINSEDTLTSITGKDGSFVFAGLATKQWEMVVTMKGYITTRKKFSIGKDRNSLILGPIVLQVDYKELDPVIVSRVRPITIGEDTISYHAAAYSVREGSEIEALLKRLPGIEVDINGNVIVQGKKVGRVMVNGKGFFGGDVLTATRNLPADIVDKIQIIDDYGDKARLTGVKSGQSVKVLNIVLKEDKRNGQFGHVQAGGGNEGKYAGNAYQNLFKNERQLSISGSLENNSPAGNNYGRNIGLSYADRWSKKWTGEGSFNLSGDDPSSSGSMVQDNYYAGGQLHQESTNQTKGSNRSGNFNTSLTYKPDLYHTLRISPSVSLQQTKQSVSSTSSTLQQDSGFSKITAGTSLTQTQNRSITAGTDLYYEQLSTHSKNRFSIQINGQYSSNQQPNDNLVNTLIQADSINSRSVLHYLTNNTGKGWTINATTNYFVPLGKSSFLELGYSLNNSLTQNNKLTRQTDSTHPYPIKVDSLSNEYTFQSMTQRIHAGYSAHFQHLNLTLSIDGQPGAMSGTVSDKGGTTSYHYFSVLPVAQFSWAFTRSRTLSFQYNGNPELPGLQQLQPLTNLSNPQYPILGNPSLKPAFSQTFNLHYEQSSLQPTQFYGFGLDLGYDTKQNPIITNIVHPKDTGSVIQQTTYLNAGNISSYHAGYHFNLPAIFHKHLRIVLNGNIVHVQNPTMTDNILYTTISQNWSQSLHIQYILPDIIESDLSGNYNATNTRYPSGGSQPATFASADWAINNRHYFGHRWILAYTFSQGFTSGIHLGLRANPALLTASLQKQFLKKNRATFSLIGYDLLNSNTGVYQSVSPTSVTKSQTVLIGRYFMISFLWKWGKFGE